MSKKQAESLELIEKQKDLYKAAWKDVGEQLENTYQELEAVKAELRKMQDNLDWAKQDINTLTKGISERDGLLQHRDQRVDALTAENEGLRVNEYGYKVQVYTLQTLIEKLIKGNEEQDAA